MYGLLSAAGEAVTLVDLIDRYGLPVALAIVLGLAFWASVKRLELRYDQVVTKQDARYDAIDQRNSKLGEHINSLEREFRVVLVEQVAKSNAHLERHAVVLERIAKHFENVP